MSSVHYRLNIIKRSEGRSAVAAAAYRAAEKIYDHRTGLWHDFTRKGGLVHSEILLPEQAPAYYHDRAILWNAVEHAEKNKNAQVSRDLIVGLPVELGHEAQIDLIRNHVQREYVDRGMCADFCVHDNGDGNPHAHVMFTMRPINQDGTWGDKSRREYVLNKQGERILLPSGNDWKSRKVSLIDWGNQGNAEKWRAAWEDDVNREYVRLGLPERISMTSYEKQGLDREPTEHLGPAAAAMEKKGQHTEVGDHNRAVQKRNNQREHARHIRNLEAAHFSQREQTPEAQRPSFDEWLTGYQKEHPQGLEREKSRGRERGR